MSWRASLIAVALAAAVCPTLSHAQDGGGNNGGGRQRNNGGGGNNGGGQRGGWDPAQMMQRRMDQLKEQLGAQDDEWKVIEPKLNKIMQAQMQAMAGMGRGMGFGGRGPGGGEPPAPTTKLGIAAADLRKATQSDASSAEDIDKKLVAYRAAKAEAQTNLEAARKDLKDVLTPKQEAVLVLANVLE